MNRYAKQARIPRRELELALWPADVIAYTINDLLEQIIPEQEEAHTFDVTTLGVGGRWDALTDSFLVNAKVEVAAQ